MLNEIEKLETDWKSVLLENKSIIDDIDTKISYENSKLPPHLQVFPKMGDIFRAFNYFNISDTNVVILGQDCYHGKDQANGLCFSVNSGRKIPPSLRNILKEMRNDLGIDRESTDFTDIARQGVLFLNSALTVREKTPLSHMHLWMELTDLVIKHISDNCNNVIFVLWGGYAKSKKRYINNEKHYILDATHPSPLSANRGGFFGCKHFSKINELLEKKGKDKIKFEDT